jgi:uncharacterized alpha-E superfamily protein
LISRVAESCFWLHRHVERADNIVRLLRVNRSFVLDVSLPIDRQWRPVLVVSGEHHRFPTLFSEDAQGDGELVQEYMTWNERNPVSIVSAVKWARENARTIRDVISLEMWSVLNELWHWLRRGAARRQFDQDRDAFYRHVQDASALFFGMSQTTMLHEEPFDFMRLGMLLERAGQTARIVDVKHHALGPSQPGRPDTPVETAEWMALLRSVSASEPFFKRTRTTPNGRAAVGFVLLEPGFPRSVLHCVDRALRFLGRVHKAAGEAVGHESAARLGELRDRLRAYTAERLFEVGVHEELTRLIDTTADICQTIHDEYFDPPLRAEAQTNGARPDGARDSPEAGPPLAGAASEGPGRVVAP